MNRVKEDNPFERYDLDPREGVAAITARLKELAEETTDEAERERIRAAWETLTLHPKTRLRAALFAHPETREPLGLPPVKRLRPAAPEALGLRDLAALPSVVVAIGLGGVPVAEDPIPSLEEDPLI